MTIPFLQCSEKRARHLLRRLRAYGSTCGNRPTTKRANCIRALIHFIIMIIRIGPHNVRRGLMDFFRFTSTYDRSKVSIKEGKKFICNRQLVRLRVTTSNFHIRVRVVRMGSRRRITLLSMTETRGTIP